MCPSIVAVCYVLNAWPHLSESAIDDLNLTVFAVQLIPPNVDASSTAKLSHGFYELRNRDGLKFISRHPRKGFFKSKTVAQYDYRADSWQ